MLHSHALLYSELKGFHGLIKSISVYVLLPLLIKTLTAWGPVNVLFRVIFWLAEFIVHVSFSRDMDFLGINNKSVHEKEIELILMGQNGNDGHLYLRPEGYLE